jgi:hypothetical protein
MKIELHGWNFVWFSISEKKHNLISGFHRALLLSITFIVRLMHSVIQNLEVKIYVVQKFKRQKLKKLKITPTCFGSYLTAVPYTHTPQVENYAAKDRPSARQNICESLRVISVKNISVLPDDGSHKIRKMSEWFLIFCLLNFYTK